MDVADRGESSFVQIRTAAAIDSIAWGLVSTVTFRSSKKNQDPKDNGDYEHSEIHTTSNIIQDK